MPQNLNFDAAISAWVRKTTARMTAVFQESTQRVIQEMIRPVGDGGNMPVDTGFLRASLRAYIGKELRLATVGNPGKAKASFDEGSYVLTIASAKIGQTITAVFIANYARRVEEGFVGQDSAGRKFNQSGRHFVKLAAQRWPTIVKQVCAELRSKNP